MSNFIKSFSPLLKKLKFKNYLVEVVLLTVAVIITIAALIIYSKNNQEVNYEEIIANDKPSQVLSNHIFVDVSGAVKNPNLYQVNFGARIKEVIDKAGGLSPDADVIFFSRNFNLARIVSDQEKIYIPSIAEINSGIFIQNPQALSYREPNTSLINDQQLSINNSFININSATIEELDQLPGIGQVTANKIIIGRPYLTIDELLTKKVVNKGVFEKIKNLISL